MTPSRGVASWFAPRFETPDGRAVDEAEDQSVIWSQADASPRLLDALRRDAPERIVESAALIPSDRTSPSD